MKINPQELLSGYATEILSNKEKGILFEAALDDQELFDRLVEEEAWREALSQEGARQSVLDALETSDLDTEMSAKVVDMPCHVCEIPENGIAVGVGKSWRKAWTSSGLALAAATFLVAVGLWWFQDLSRHRPPPVESVVSETQSTGETGDQEFVFKSGGGLKSTGEAGGQEFVSKGGYSLADTAKTLTEEEVMDERISAAPVLLEDADLFVDSVERSVRVTLLAEGGRKIDRLEDLGSEEGLEIRLAPDFQAWAYVLSRPGAGVPWTLLHPRSAGEDRPMGGGLVIPAMDGERIVGIQELVVVVSSTREPMVERFSAAFDVDSWLDLQARRFESLPYRRFVEGHEQTWAVTDSGEGIVLLLRYRR